MKDTSIENDEIKKMLCLIYNQNDYIIKKIDELSSNNSEFQNSKEVNDIKEFMDISIEMNNYFKEKKLTYKQHYVLKYHLSNDYVSDTYLSDKTGVSYSSISQWKHKNSLFRELYDKIKSFK